MSNEKKKSLVEWYRSLNKLQTELFWIGLVDFVVFVALIPFFTLGYLSLSLGWLLGSLISICSHLTMNFSAKVILKDASGKAGGAMFSILFFFLRMFLWAVGLVISGICTFKSEWFNGWDLLNFWTCFAAYFPGTIVLIISNFRARKVEGREPSKKESEDK